MRNHAFRGCLTVGVAIILFSISVSQGIPKHRKPRHSGHQTEQSKNENKDGDPLERLPAFPPIWLPQQSVPQIVEIIRDEKPKEGAQCTKGENWGEVFLFYWCIIWTYITPEQMTALFTVILGISTIGLWRATKRLSALAEHQLRDMKDSIAAAEKSAEAAILQAKAAVASEIGDIAVVRIDLAPFHTSPGQPDTAILGGSVPEHSSVVILVINPGRTNVTIIKTCIEYLVVSRTSYDKSPDPPEKPIYKNITGRQGLVLLPSEPIALKMEDEIINLDINQREAIKNDDAWLWVYGYLVFQDFMEEKRIMGFVAHWDASSRSPGFIGEGPPAYVYKRKQKSDDI